MNQSTKTGRKQFPAFLQTHHFIQADSRICSGVFAGHRPAIKKMLAFTLCLFIGLIALTGCSANENEFEQKSYTAAVPAVLALQIDVDDRKIELEPSQDGNIHISYYQSSKEFYDINTIGGTLSMASKDDKDWTDYIGTSAPLEKRTIRVQFPVGGLKSFALKTSNEDVYLPAASFSESVSISVNNGNIQLERLDAGKKIELAAKDGNITGTVAGGYDDFAISCKVKKGKSNLPESKKGGEKELAVTVNNGDIDLALIKG